MKPFFALSVFLFTGFSTQAATLACKDAQGNELLRANFQAHESISRVLSPEEVAQEPAMATITGLSLMGPLSEFVGGNYNRSSEARASGEFDYNVDQLDLYFFIKGVAANAGVGEYKYYNFIILNAFQRDAASLKFVPNPFPLDAVIESREFFYPERTERFFCLLNP